MAFVAFVAEGEHGELGEAAASAGKSGASNNVINHLVGNGLGFYIGFIVLTCFNHMIWGFSPKIAISSRMAEWRLNLP